MLLTDFRALPDFVQRYETFLRDMEKIKGHPKLYKRALERKYDLLAPVQDLLQEILCRTNPGKAVPFVMSELVVTKFLELIRQEEKRKLLCDDAKVSDYIMIALNAVGML